MELGLVPLVGRDMSRGVFTGGCEVSTSLGSLFADGWGCVPPLLVVLPEASQHWSLQTIGWGQVSVPKNATSKRTHTDQYSLGPPPPESLPPQ